MMVNVENKQNSESPIFFAGLRSVAFRSYNKQ